MCTILHYKMLIQVISVVSGKMLSYTHDPTHITPLLTPPTSPTSDPSHITYFWPLPHHLLVTPPTSPLPTSSPWFPYQSHKTGGGRVSVTKNKEIFATVLTMFSCRWKEKLVMQTLRGQWEHKLAHKLHSLLEIWYLRNSQFTWQTVYKIPGVLNK